MQVYLGIDWSEKKHDVVFTNSEGALLAQFVMEHNSNGFQKLDQACQQLGVKAQACLVGLETAHNLLIDYLWSRDYTQVYVLPPSMVHANQGRFGSSGSMNDPKAAQLIAEILRTDRGRLQPWHPDSLLTRQLRAQVSLVLHLTQQTTRLSNRLRSLLLRYYPAALQVFKGGLGSQISLAFLQAYPCPDQAVKLSLDDLRTFTQAHRYPQAHLGGCWARLQVAYPKASSETVQVYQNQAVLLAGLLLQTMQLELKERRELLKLFGRHPDYATFASLPGAGDFLAPALCAKFGDDRQRFPNPVGPRCLAGTCPVTVRSGKSRYVIFRQACDREWRHICQLWAKALVIGGASPIAVAYYEAVRPHCKNDSHAYRCLANRWLGIAWKLWQTHSTYDEAYHFQHISARRKPRA